MAPGNAQSEAPWPSGAGTSVVRTGAGPCLAAHFAGDVPMFAFADGTLRRGGDPVPLPAHSALLAAAPTADHRALVTSGEDGRVCRTGGAGVPLELARVSRKWVPYLAASLRGTLAYAAGRSVWLYEGPGRVREIQHPRSVAALAFSPDGERIAVARYGGVSIHPLHPGAQGAELEWNGLYTALAFSPDGRFLVAFMQEALIHGWRLDDGRHFRMIGYPQRIRDWSWSVDGRWLATSGAGRAILWPFEGAEGPIGAAALELGAPREGVQVTAVACHPTRAQMMIGHADGTLCLAGIDDGGVWPLRCNAQGAISAAAWHTDGSSLAFGTEHGEYGVLDVPC